MELRVCGPGSLLALNSPIPPFSTFLFLFFFSGRGKGTRYSCESPSHRGQDVLTLLLPPLGWDGMISACSTDWAEMISSRLAREQARMLLHYKDIVEVHIRQVLKPFTHIS